MHAIIKNKLLLVTYMLTMLFALHYAIPLYATSSFLHIYFDSADVSALYVVASIITLIASLLISKSIRRFHTYGFTFFLVIAEIVISYIQILSEKSFFVLLGIAERIAVIGCTPFLLIAIASRFADTVSRGTLLRWRFLARTHGTVT